MHQNKERFERERDRETETEKEMATKLNEKAVEREKTPKNNVVLYVHNIKIIQGLKDLIYNKHSHTSRAYFLGLIVLYFIVLYKTCRNELGRDLKRLARSGKMKTKEGFYLMQYITTLSQKRQFPLT